MYMYVFCFAVDLVSRIPVREIKICENFVKPTIACFHEIKYPRNIRRIRYSQLWVPSLDPLYFTHSFGSPAWTPSNLLTILGPQPGPPLFYSQFWVPRLDPLLVRNHNLPSFRIRGHGEIVTCIVHLGGGGGMRMGIPYCRCIS